MEGLQVFLRRLRQPWEDFKYTPLGKGEYGFDIRRRPAIGSIARIVISVIGLICFVAGACTYGTSAYHNSEAATDYLGNDLVDRRYDVVAGSKRFVVVVFGSDPSPALCKVMMSAIAMGYPMPVVVNWGQHIEDYFPLYIRKTHPDHVGPHLLKIVGALQYLDEVTHKTGHGDDKLGDDDLVLMVDAYDVWFQTPPEVLIRRYHEQNLEAKERFMKQWPGRKSDMPMHQSIIISSQKKCYPLPGAAYDLQCDKIPDSPLRSDLYGWRTDPKPYLLDKKVEDYHNVRPKFINSGAILGTVGALRKFLRKSKERMDDKAVNDRRILRSDQGMMGEIWGEQEVYRTWQRANARNWNKIGDLFMQQRDFEYGVGLDYKQDICIATVFEETDGDIVTLNDKNWIAKHSRELGITPTRLHGVPADLEHSKNPLSILPEFQNKNVSSWGEMPIYADFFTSSVPAMVHHNAHVGGLKNRNILWWDRMWYFPYLRELVTARLETPGVDPIAEVTARDGRKAVYYPVGGDARKRLPRVFLPGSGRGGLPLGKWDDLCVNLTSPETHWSEEVFRDGKGGLNGTHLINPKPKPKPKPTQKV